MKKNLSSVFLQTLRGVERFQPLAIMTKRSILDFAAALDPPLDS